MKNQSKFKSFILSPMGKFTLTLLLYVIFLTLFCIIVECFNSNISIAIISVICIYFGWQALNRITPSIFLILPFGGWIIYFFIKGLLSIIVGVFVAPYVIAKKITSNIQGKV